MPTVDILLAGIADDARLAPMEVLTRRLDELNALTNQLDTPADFHEHARSMFITAGRTLIALASLGNGPVAHAELVKWRGPFELAIDRLGHYATPEMHDIVARTMWSHDRAALPS